MVRHVRFTNSPDARPDPGERRQYHTHDGAQGKNTNGAITSRKGGEMDAQPAIREGKYAPGDKARNQQPAGLPHEADDRYEEEKAESGGCDNVALESYAIQSRDSIGNVEPGGERDSQAYAGAGTRAHSRIV